jgi:glycine betaine/proline transport system substrate-binding protein
LHSEAPPHDLRCAASATPRARPWFSRLVAALIASLLASLAHIHTATAAAAADPPACQSVRLSDAGWSDVTATTALLVHLLKGLGYRPQVTLLSVPVTFASLKNGDIDVFLGNWMPAEAADIAPYVADGSITVLRPNLVGAKYTLAVPTYTYAAGLHDFKDIRRFAAQLNHSIYGLEPGNDGNHHVLQMLRNAEFGLNDFTLVESSEQGMLAEVERAYGAHRPIVFLAWSPHPMNLRFDLEYLSGGDATFGPNFGSATVNTVIRTGYAEQCPNVGRLLQNLTFTVPGESEMMASLIEQHLPPEAAAELWFTGHRNEVARWLDGVLTASGAPASGAGPVARPAGAHALERWVSAHKLPLGLAMTEVVDSLKARGRPLFAAVSTAIHAMVDGLIAALRLVPSPLLILSIAGLAWLAQRSLGIAAFVAAALLFIMNQGYWDATIETLALVMWATLLAALIGVPLGIASAHHPRLHSGLRPVLDLMQTLPTFVYLIPTLVLFGLGVVPGLISTVIFAMPAPVRLTHLGISSVPRPLLEAGQAFGATPLQLLVKVEIPAAAPMILAGVTQAIMLSLSMVVIAALVGAGGLGVPVVRALNTVQISTGFEAGFAIVLLAMIIDRISRPRVKGR